MKTKKEKILIIVGSQNPVKIKAVKYAFKKVFKKIEVKSLKVISGIPDQPFSFEQAFKGALNRAKECKKKYKQADFVVGLEGSLQKYSFGWATAGVAVILDKKGIIGKGISSQLILPDKVVKMIKKGKELGLVLDEISGGRNLKQKQGAFGYFTDNLVTRKDAYIQAVFFSLARFIKKDFYE